MEYCNGGNLEELIDSRKQLNKKLEVWQVKKIALDIAKGLNFIHQKNLVHMDIKPDNIFRYVFIYYKCYHLEIQDRLRTCRMSKFI